MHAIVYSKTTCPFCVRAKELLTKSGYTIEEKIVDGVNITKETMNQDLGKTDLGTVPQIVLDGVFIPGGYSGLVTHFAEKK